MHRWHIALTENSSRDLETAEALRDRGYLVFNPRCPKRVYWGRNRFVRRVRPMFPGYLFVDEPIAQGWRRLQTCPGVRTTHSLMQGAEGYAVLPIEAYHEMRRVEISLMNPIDSSGRERQFQPGSDVFIRSGPFAGFFARVGDLDDGESVELLLSIFGRESRTFISPVHLVAASP